MMLPTLRQTLTSSLLVYAAGCGSVKETPDAGVPVDAPPSIEPPVNTVSSGTVAEAATLSLASRLVSTDADTPAQFLTYTVLTLPTDGALKLNGTDLAVNGTFTQKDVADGNVSYVHGGSEDGGDSFDWSLSDGTNSIATTLFPITVTPTNDAPMIVNNANVVVAEGGITVLDATHLSATDVENGSITYTFVSVIRGQLQLRVGAAPFAAMTAGQTFTQQDIIDGNVRFQDPGTDDAMLAVQTNTTASFSWRVEDGQGGVNPSPTGANVTNFTVTSVDDAPVIAWKPATCGLAGANHPVSPIASFSDVDNTLPQYTVCLVSRSTGESIQGTVPGTTLTQIPLTVQNNVADMLDGACLAANALNLINVDSAATTHRGSTTWRLMKGATQFGANGTIQHPVKAATPCP